MKKRKRLSSQGKVALLGVLWKNRVDACITVGARPFQRPPAIWPGDHLAIFDINHFLASDTISLSLHRFSPPLQYSKKEKNLSYHSKDRQEECFSNVSSDRGRFILREQNCRDRPYWYGRRRDVDQIQRRNFHRMTHFYPLLFFPGLSGHRCIKPRARRLFK